jgi:hypothetical protein
MIQELGPQNVQGETPEGEVTRVDILWLFSIAIEHGPFYHL